MAKRVKFEIDQIHLKKSLGDVFGKLERKTEHLLAEQEAPIKERLEQTVPRETGTLAGTLFAETKRTRSGPTVEFGTRGSKYARFVEFGTSERAAHPFVRPVVSSTRYRLKTRRR